MKSLTPLQNAISIIGGVLLIIGALLPLAGVLAQYAPYVFTLGALSYGGTQILRRYEGKNTTIIRLRRQEIIGAFLLMVSAVLMLVSSFRLLPLQGGEWKLCLAVAVVFQYTPPSGFPKSWTKKRVKRSRKTDKTLASSAICCIFATIT